MAGDARGDDEHRAKRSRRGKAPGAGAVTAKTVGLRREDKNRWERRVPLSPAHCATLVQDGYRVVVQPSALRVFTDDEYSAVGCEIDEDLSAAGTIMAVKEVPKELLLPDRSYVYFSHTIKGQTDNMPMLDDILAKRIRLFDFERIVDDAGDRLVKFGEFAGIAGMIDWLHFLGNRLLALGMSTPFLHVGVSYMYDSVADAKADIATVGAMMQSRGGLPAEICPLTFVFTGKGATSKGAFSILEVLPHKVVTVEELKKLSEVKEPTNEMRRTVYACLVNSSDTMVPKEAGKTYSRQHFRTHPDQYRSVFADEILPHASVLVNCVYWHPGFPRLVSNDEWGRLVDAGNHRLLGICDVSCDVGGSIEFMKKCTTIDQPTFVYNHTTGKMHDGFYGDGVMIFSVDHLPTELPREASTLFGDALLPHVRNLLDSDMARSFDDQTDLSPVWRRACIACNGELTPDYQYITELRREHESHQHKVLLLGAGLVAPALVEYLAKQKDYVITIASQIFKDADRLTNGRSNVHLEDLDANNEDLLNKLVANAHLVVSFLPYQLHGKVARLCVRNKRNMVTASYVQDDVRAMADEFAQAGIVVLNEVGFDPGLDHISIMQTVEQVHKAGGKVTSLLSTAGGLPAPECSDNPLGYKFSWSPMGVLQAGLNSATYREDGKVVEVDGGKLFETAKPMHVLPAFALEVLPNRNSLSYGDLYGLPQLETIFRGTLRYQGYSRILAAMRDLGLLDMTERDALKEGGAWATWDDVIMFLTGADAGDDLGAAVCSKLGLDAQGEHGRAVVDAMRWLGLFRPTTVSRKGTLRASLCVLLEERMALGAKERDMAIMHHEFGISWKDGSREIRKSTLIMYGDPESGLSAMSRSVGLTAAVAVRLILEGKVTDRGLISPTNPQLYTAMLDLLEEEGIEFREQIVEVV